MNFWHEKKVVVTGGAGFLSSFVVEKLKDYNIFRKEGRAFHIKNCISWTANQMGRR